MITEIIGESVVVENKGKKTGVYLLSDFDDDELKEEKMLLTSVLLVRPVYNEEVGHIYDLISLINGELDKRGMEKL